MGVLQKTTETLRLRLQGIFNQYLMQCNSLKVNEIQYFNNTAPAMLNVGKVTKCLKLPLLEAPKHAKNACFDAFKGQMTFLVEAICRLLEPTHVVSGAYKCSLRRPPEFKYWLVIVK